MGWMPAARRIESSRSVVARASSTDASRLRLGSVPFGSVPFGSFVRGTSSRSHSRRKVRNHSSIVAPFGSCASRRVRGV